MKIIMPCITGTILSLIASSLGYDLNNWQWWTFVIVGMLYILNYDKLSKL